MADYFNYEKVASADAEMDHEHAEELCGVGSSNAVDMGVTTTMQIWFVFFCCIIKVHRLVPTSFWLF